ncbi:hypothetical protein T10_7919, partial [Trichinella papuae]
LKFSIYIYIYLFIRVRWVSCSLLLLHFNKNAVNVMQKIHIKPRPSVRKFHGFTFASYLIANMPAVRQLRRIMRHRWGV